MHKKVLFHYSLQMKATNVSENTREDERENERLSSDFRTDILQESMLENETSDTEVDNMEMLRFSRESGSAICKPKDRCGRRGNNAV